MATNTGYSVQVSEIREQDNYDSLIATCILISRRLIPIIAKWLGDQGISEDCKKAAADVYSALAGALIGQYIRPSHRARACNWFCQIVCETANRAAAMGNIQSSFNAVNNGWSSFGPPLSAGQGKNGGIQMFSWLHQMQGRDGPEPLLSAVEPLFSLITDAMHDYFPALNADLQAEGPLMLAPILAVLSGIHVELEVEGLPPIRIETCEATGETEEIPIQGLRDLFCKAKFYVLWTVAEKVAVPAPNAPEMSAVSH